jgi:hypothetical protein
MTLPEVQRLRKYTRDYFTARACPEIQSWHKKILRTDIASCLCYALGNPDVEAMRKVSGIPFREHLDKIAAGATRTPKLAVDIGAGRGEILALLSLLDITAIGLDPSPGADVLVPQTMAEWAPQSKFHMFYNLDSYRGMCILEDLAIDTIIMCESLEHIREEEFDQTWELICASLRKTSGLFIVGNWIKNHPLGVDGTGYDHIRRVDDALYNKLASDATKTLVRKGSHMVLQF